MGRRQGEKWTPRWERALLLDRERLTTVALLGGTGKGQDCKERERLG